MVSNQKKNLTSNPINGSTPEVLSVYSIRDIVSSVNVRFVRNFSPPRSVYISGIIIESICCQGQFFVICPSVSVCINLLNSGRLWSDTNYISATDLMGKSDPAGIRSDVQV
jgi:hypothetical protein